jgi:predicted glycosyltransferase involved in capsule biosynthesis
MNYVKIPTILTFIFKNLKTVDENSRLPCYAINPLNGQKIPIYFKNDSKFGTLNAQGTPYLDSKLGSTLFLMSPFNFFLIKKHIYLLRNSKFEPIR